eukprot:5640053-Alexandrium_andersonii.AAC.1
MLTEHEGFEGEVNPSWRKWRACLENYVSGMSPNWVELLDECAKAARPITARAVDPSAHGFAETETQRKMDATLSTELINLLAGEPDQIARNMCEKSGVKPWRQLTTEYEPNAGDQAPAWDQEILEGNVLKGATADTFEEKLLNWEQLVEKHEESTGTILESDIKRAVLIKRTPVEGREQLAFTAAELATYDTYDKMRLAILCYCKMCQDWDLFLNANIKKHENNHTPTEMDA